MFDLQSFRINADQAFSQLQTEVGSLRTGGASPQLLDSVRVEAYGTTMKVTELAAISASDPTMLIVSPWDKSVLPAIEKAIQQAGINLNPIVDGDIIRISVPPLTQEDRQQLVKILRQKIEAGKVALRNIRTDTKKQIEAQEGQAGISQDDIKADLDALEKAVKDYTNNIDQLADRKQAELMKV